MELRKDNKKLQSLIKEYDSYRTAKILCGQKQEETCKQIHSIIHGDISNFMSVSDRLHHDETAKLETLRESYENLVDEIFRSHLK